MIRYVLCMAMGLAVAMAQDSAPPPAPQPPRQETDKPSRLSASEISRLKAKAEGGDSGAQATLGKAYKNGNGVTKSDASALTWLRKAADQGEADAENDLGVMYRMGEGVPQDKEEAVRWYKKAARQGNSKAMFNLGASYYNGDGVQIDDVASYGWFLLAQEAGNPAADEALRRAASEREAGRDSAFVKVAEMYETGDDLSKNPDQALKWYRKAADAGGAKASVTVAKLLLSAGRSLTPEEGAEVRQRCEDAAKRNFSPGAYCMVLIYKQGLGTPKDEVEAQKWLGRAAELGHPQAALELGEAYWRGEGVKTDLVTAYMWIWLALSAKLPGAQQDEQALQKEMSPKQVEQAKRKANEWVVRHRFPTIYERQGGNLRPQH
jgi:TPR repeat protein